MTSNTYTGFMSAGGFGNNGSAVRRIRTPHPHDVLSGRGGGINAHPGNVVFREWVRVRKEDYNLAPNKAEKTKVALEVIDQVRQQDPPGRFLIRDQSTTTGGTWWIEVDENKALAKTSQALREGAPQIRSAHKDEIQQRKEQFAKDHPKQPHASSTTTNNKTAKRKRKAAVALPSKTATATPAVTAAPKYARGGSSLTRRLAQGGAIPSVTIPSVNQQQQQQFGQIDWTTASSPGKPANSRSTTAVVDEDGSETPPLVPHVPPPSTGGPGEMETLTIGLPHDVTTGANNGGSLSSFPNNVNRVGGGLPRVHSLALSDFSFGNITESGMGESPSMDEDFVNPFADESDFAYRAESSGGSSDPKYNRRNTSVGSSTLRNLSSSDDSSPNLSDENHYSKWDVDLFVDENESSNLDSEFVLGVKGILDAIHPSDWTTPETGDEDHIPTILMPWRGMKNSAVSVRRSTSSASSGRNFSWQQ